MEMLTRHLPTLVRVIILSYPSLYSLTCIVQELHLNAQHLEQELYELTETLNLRDSFSSFPPHYWRVFTLVFLKACVLSYPP